CARACRIDGQRQWIERKTLSTGIGAVCTLPEQTVFFCKVIAGQPYASLQTRGETFAILGVSGFIRKGMRGSHALECLRTNGSIVIVIARSMRWQNHRLLCMAPIGAPIANARKSFLANSA